MTSPVYFDKFSISRNYLNTKRSIVSIDAGGTMTKIVCQLKVNKETETNDENKVELAMVTFPNNQMEDALDWLSSNAVIFPEDDLPITGTEAVRQSKLIEEKTGLRVKEISEPAATSKSMKFMIENDHYTMWTIDKTSIKSDNSQFVNYPLLYLCSGTAAGVLFLPDENSLCDLKTFSMWAGKNSYGFAQLLIGTMEYNEIMELAMKGNANNVDLTRDLSDSQTCHQFQRIDRLVSPFGSIGTNGENFSKEDLAASLISMMTDHYAYLTMSAVEMTGVTKLIVGGNGFRHEYMRSTFNKKLTEYTQVPLKIGYLKHGHGTAIGCLLV